MRKFLLVFFLGGIIGLAAGFAVGVFVYPYIFLADIVAAETAPDANTNRPLASGMFIHADPSDPVHYGKGSVTVYADTVHLGADFEVGPGPKYHVYLVPRAKGASSAEVKGAKFIDLGRLRAFKGSQNFAIPAAVNPAEFNSVVIWCEAFGVLISPATLKFAAR